MNAGLPHERTVLAWQRTGVSSCAVAGVCGLDALHRHDPLLWAAAAVALAGTGLAVAVLTRASTGYVRVVVAAAAVGLLSLAALAMALSS